MNILNDREKTDIKLIFGEIYDEIFRNRLTYEISKDLKELFKDYKNNYDEEFTKKIVESINSVSNSIKNELDLTSKELVEAQNKLIEQKIKEIFKFHFQDWKASDIKKDELLKAFIGEKMNSMVETLLLNFKELKKEHDEDLKSTVRREIKEDILEIKKSMWVSTKKIIKKYSGAFFSMRQNSNFESQILVIKWFVLISLLINIILFIFVLIK